MPVGVTAPLGFTVTVKVTGVPKEASRFVETIVVVVEDGPPPLLPPLPPQPNTKPVTQSINPQAAKKFLGIFDAPEARAKSARRASPARKTIASRVRANNAALLREKEWPRPEMMAFFTELEAEEEGEKLSVVVAGALLTVTLV